MRSCVTFGALSANGVLQTQKLLAEGLDRQFRSSDDGLVCQTVISIFGNGGLGCQPANSQKQKNGLPCTPVTRALRRGGPGTSAVCGVPTLAVHTCKPPLIDGLHYQTVRDDCLL